LIPSLIAGKFDVIAASLSITPERKKAVSFTNRYYRTPIRFITAKNQTLVISPEGLKGKKIGAQRATTAAIYLNANFAGIVDIKLYDTQENAYLDLRSGRLDSVLSDAIMGWSWLLSGRGWWWWWRRWWLWRRWCVCVWG
jgi:polar amino acid transport system substrate-binding protein